MTNALIFFLSHNLHIVQVIGEKGVKLMDDKKRITLRLPDELYGALKEISEATGITIHSLVLAAICRHLNML